MEAVILSGLSAGIATVILCTSEIAEPIRQRINKPFHCPFCTSFWCSLVFDPSPTVLATMAVANITVLLTHWSMTTYGDENDETNPEAEAVTRSGQEGDGPR